jgi:hypothetical protein
MNNIYRKFNIIPNKYIIKTIYRNTYNKKLMNIIKMYGPIQSQYDYSFIDEKFTTSLKTLHQNKGWYEYFDELNTIEYQHDDMNIMQSTGLVLINKKNEYIFFNNTLTQWYPSTKVMTINLEEVFNEYEDLKIKSFFEKNEHIKRL